LSELVGGAVDLERSLQSRFEENLEALLGVRFLASEYRITDGRMDTLGIDENDAPVIIEYKRSSNENVINQGLFYLNWLVDHKGDFELLVQRELDMEAAQSIDWNGPRLICIANNFTKYDEHAVRQMNRNIDLIRYKEFPPDLLLLEQLTSTTAIGGSGVSSSQVQSSSAGAAAYRATVTDHLEGASSEMLDRYGLIRDYLLACGDDVQEKTLDNYVAFRRIKNFACVQLRNQIGKVLVYLRVDPANIELEDGFMRDMRNKGHYGTGDLELNIMSDDDFERAKPYFDKAYNNA
jgi:predicted transport protein|tara:strand:+ start:120 stop:998 length:879 start_codon:yes stop_codon:yes gene_type:complete